MFFSNKFISYVSSYVGPIQIGFLRGFRKSSGGTGIVIPVKKCHRSGKHRNPEDSCRNFQPSHCVEEPIQSHALDRSRVSQDYAPGSREHQEGFHQEIQQRSKPRPTRPRQLQLPRLVRGVCLGSAQMEARLIKPPQKCRSAKYCCWYKANCTSSCIKAEHSFVNSQKNKQFGMLN